MRVTAFCLAMPALFSASTHYVHNLQGDKKTDHLMLVLLSSLRTGRGGGPYKASTLKQKEVIK